MEFIEEIHRRGGTKIVVHHDYAMKKRSHGRRKIQGIWVKKGGWLTTMRAFEAARFESVAAAMRVRKAKLISEYVEERGFRFTIHLIREEYGRAFNKKLKTVEVYPQPNVIELLATVGDQA
jgi:hypothetical protein